jgi:hypothetical protein
VETALLHNSIQVVTTTALRGLSKTHAWFVYQQASSHPAVKQAFEAPASHLSERLQQRIYFKELLVIPMGFEPILCFRNRPAVNTLS